MSDLLPPADVRTYFPLIGGLFIYILVCNLMGLIPGFLPPTDYINTSAGLAAQAAPPPKFMKNTRNLSIPFTVHG